MTLTVDLTRLIIRLLKDEVKLKKKERIELFTSVVRFSFSGSFPPAFRVQRVQTVAPGDLQNLQHNELCWGQSGVWEENQIYANEYNIDLLIIINKSFANVYVASHVQDLGFCFGL